jgi:hypothetical protein
MRSASDDHVEGFVVVIAALFALCHGMFDSPRVVGGCGTGPQRNPVFPMVP